MTETEGQTFRTVHELCGNEIETELPPGYPVAEGVGLWCRYCRQSFWHVPGGTGEGASAFAAEPAAAQDEAPEAAVSEAAVVEAPGPRRPRASWRFVGAVAVALALIAAVAVIAASSGGDDDEGAATIAQEPTVAAEQPTAAASEPPTEEAEATIAPASARLADKVVTYTLPGGWVPLANTVGADAPDGTARVTISAAPRKGRSLARLAADARAALQAELPRRRIGRAHRIQLNNRPAIRVAASRGRLVRQLTLIPIGDRRFMVTLELGADASAQTRRDARVLADTVSLR